MIDVPSRHQCTSPAVHTSTMPLLYPTNVLRISEFYKDEVIFITGASGFLGKALLEKLFRSCSDLQKIYILLRKKRGVAPQERWHKLMDEEVFKLLRTHRPDILKTKVVALEGDLRELRLGLSDEDYTLLQDTVTQIFHVAATVRFDEPIRDAIFMNTRGTREVVHLALGAKKLKAFIHVSTSFSNPCQEITKEIVYPAPVNWKEAIKSAELLDPILMASLQPKYLSGFPNTYTFAKNLAESIIWEYRNEIPAVIIRPSVVVSSISEPYPAYIENLNGPVAILMGSGMQVLRNCLSDGTCSLDYVAVDEVVQVAIASAWFAANWILHDNMRVFNLTNPTFHINNNDFGNMFQHIGDMRPLANQHILLPGFHNATNEYVFRCRTVVTQVLPACVIDLALKVWKIKTINLVNIQIKIAKAQKALQYFITKSWHFPNENTLYLKSRILPEDKDDFGKELLYYDIDEYCTASCLEGTRHFLKIDMTEEYSKKGRRIRARTKIWHFILRLAFRALIVSKVHSYIIGCED